MADTFQLIYTHFVLRDALGYMIPGAVVALTIVWLFVPHAVVVNLFGSPADDRRPAFMELAPHWFLALAVCYLIGHGIAGLAFNVISPNPLFSYHSTSYIHNDQQLATHTHAYAQAAGTASHSIERERERFAVLLHLTGNASACFVISASLIAIAATRRSPNQQRRLYYTVGLAMTAIAIGTWFHHYRLRDRRYFFELQVIDSYMPAQNTQQPLSKP